MRSWEIVGAAVFGLLFVVFAFFRVEIIDSQTVRAVIAVFLFAFYCGIVIFGTSDKKRTLSIFTQTLLGVLLACAVSALFGASAKIYAIAVLAGLVLGYTADLWVKHVQLP